MSALFKLNQKVSSHSIKELTQIFTLDSVQTSGHTTINGMPLSDLFSQSSETYTEEEAEDAKN